MANKVKFGLKNVHYAPITEDESGVTFGTPKRLPGAVNLTLDVQGEEVEFEADDVIYYFNEAGTVIQSDQDFAIQIPLDALRRCPNIIGVCSANTSAKALGGALKTGFFSHIVARQDLVRGLLER